MLPPEFCPKLKLNSSTRKHQLAATATAASAAAGITIKRSGLRSLELQTKVREDFTITDLLLNKSVLNVKALLGAFNQEKALIEAFFVIMNLTDSE